MYVDPKWPRASNSLFGNAGGEPVGVVGIPLGDGAISPGRCDLAPNAIREQLSRFSTATTDGTEIDASVWDHGDLLITSKSVSESITELIGQLASITGENLATILLGGHNLVTLPGVLSLQPIASLDRIGILTLDAHLDVRTYDQGLHNGCPIRALWDAGLPGSNIVQVGIASFLNSAPYLAHARQAGNRIITMAQVHENGVLTSMNEALAYLENQVDIIYFDLDLDVMDRQFALGCPGSRPGGLRPWQLIEAARICGRHPKVRMMDLVELDPPLDVHQTTAQTAAMCLMSFCAGVLEREP